MSVIGHQTAPNQKEIDRMSIRALEQGYERVLLDLIGVEQDGQRLLSRRFMTPKCI